MSADRDDLADEHIRGDTGAVVALQAPSPSFGEFVEAVPDATVLDTPARSEGHR